MNNPKLWPSQVALLKAIVEGDFVSTVHYGRCMRSLDKMGLIDATSDAIELTDLGATIYESLQADSK